jgi:hypothetical protein
MGKHGRDPLRKVRLCLEKDIVAKKKPHRKHLSGSSDLITTYEETMAGFVALALDYCCYFMGFFEPGIRFNPKKAGCRVGLNRYDKTGIDK